MFKNTHPDLPVPRDVKIVIDNSSHQKNQPHDSPDANFTTAEEVNWMNTKRNFTRPFSSPQEAKQTLERDYGASEAAIMMKSFSSLVVSDSDSSGISPLLFPLLRWSGIGTRHRTFAKWWKSLEPSLTTTGWAKKLAAEDCDKEKVFLEIFTAFAHHLGRVTTYRALALDEQSLKNIFDQDIIFPTGQLKFTAEDLQQVVEEHGIRKVLVARLFIAHLQKMIGKDPSISLHDDWQTTTLISSGYTANKKVYLFEVNVPVILSCGWNLAEVGSFGEEFLGARYRDHPPWFCFSSPASGGRGKEGCWFDATLQRTERYTFYGVPYLKKVLSRLFVFETVEEISKATSSFVEMQKKLYEKFPEGEDKEHALFKNEHQF